MCIFKKYSEIFGKVNTGVHSYRLFNIAIIDLLLTLLAAFIISYYYKKPIVHTTIFLLLLGVFFHWLFGVNTTINRYLGLTC